MSQAFRGAGAPKQTINLNDEPLEAQAEHPPALKLSIGICELIFGAFTNCVQLVTTTLAILAMIYGSTVSAMSMVGLAKSFGYTFIIAVVIGGAIQGFLHKNAQPMSSTWHRLRHIQHFNVKSTHAFSEVRNAIGIGAIFFILSLIAEVISDATFVNLFTRNAYVIVGWMLFLTGSSTLLFYDGATRIWGALEDWKDYRAYHLKNDPQGKA